MKLARSCSQLLSTSCASVRRSAALRLSRLKTVPGLASATLLPTELALNPRLGLPRTSDPDSSLHLADAPRGYKFPIAIPRPIITPA